MPAAFSDIRKYSIHEKQDVDMAHTHTLFSHASMWRKGKCCVLLLAALGAPWAHSATVWADFTSPVETNNGVAARSVVAPNNFNDVSIEPLVFKLGVVVVKGTFKPSYGANRGTMGIEVAPLAKTIAGNLTTADALSIKLSSKEGLNLRIRLLGVDVPPGQEGCYPALLVQTTPAMKDLQVPLEAFEPPLQNCVNRGVSSKEAMKNLGWVQITAAEPSDQPIEFTVGKISFDNTLQSDAISASQDRTWRLVWADDFNGSDNTLADFERWQYVVGDKENFGSEQQYYRNSTRDGAHDGKGFMQLWPRKNEDPKLLCGSTPCGYTSARLSLKPRSAQFYGRIEARIKLPDTKGMNVSMALLGAPVTSMAWPNAGEIEIFRANGDSYNIGYYHQDLDFGDITTRNLSNVSGFHTVSFEWSPQRLIWMVDGVEVHAKAVNILAPDFRQLLDTQPFTLAIGVTVDADVPATAPTSAPLIIDYIKMYQRGDLLVTGKSKYEKWSQALGLQDPVTAEAAPVRTIRVVPARPSANDAPRRVARPATPAAADPPPNAPGKLVCSRDNSLGLMLCR
jgi:beta-glucanase (GH16 family)